MDTAGKVKERPILFSGPMVRAILDGKKHQTRRVIKPQPKERLWPWEYEELLARCPFKVGQKLWVRETHYRWTGCDEAPSDWVRAPDGATYQSRGFVGIPEHDSLYEDACAAVIVPSIHMPRWASRITLELTDVRAERLQDITEEDAIAEGIDSWDGNGVGDGVRFHMGFELPRLRRFSCLWDVLNAKTPWASSPWVWALTFKPLEVQQ